MSNTTIDSRWNTGIWDQAVWDGDVYSYPALFKMRRAERTAAAIARRVDE